MKSDNSFSRGRYGILPESRVSAHQKWRFGVRICVATIMSRWCSLFSRPLRKVSTESELAWIERACDAVDFEVVRPLWAPRGHTISGLVEIPGSPNIATFVFRNGAGEQFLMEQRKSWLPIEEEVILARVPFARTTVQGNDCYVIYGFYGGEPIDHAYWFSQLSIAFEIGGIVVELREVTTRGGGVELWKLLYFVDHLIRQDADVVKSTS